MCNHFNTPAQEKVRQVYLETVMNTKIKFNVNYKTQTSLYLYCLAACQSVKQKGDYCIIEKVIVRHIKQKKIIWFLWMFLKGQLWLYTF